MGLTTPGPTNPGIRRLCFNADLKSYSSRDDVGQYEAQRAFRELLEDACERAGLDRAHWVKQPQGDGELALLPPGIDEAWTISGLLRHLRVCLYHYNRNRDETSRMRIRLAAHEGITYLADNGYAGDAVVTVCRLCASAAAKAALERSPNADLVLIVSSRIYSDVIRQNLYDLLAADFTPVTVKEASKDFATTAWLHVPGRTATDPAPAPTATESQVADQATDRGGVTNTVSGNVSGNVFSSGDISGGNITVGNRSGDTYENLHLPHARGVSFGGHHEHHGGSREG